MIIGISGKIGAGKSELSTVLQKKYGYEAHNFAGKLKQIAAILTGINEEDMYRREYKDLYMANWGMTLGELQQKLGTDAIRTGLHVNAWVLALFADYTDEMDWVISDARFPNEAEAIKDHGGILVRIDGSRTGPGGRDPNHISERALDNWKDWDYRFDNTLLDYWDLEHHAHLIDTIARHS